MNASQAALAPPLDIQPSLVRSLRATVAVAVVLFFLDTYILGQGFLSFAVTFLSTLTFLGMAIYALLKGDRLKVKKRLLQILVLWVMQVAIMGANHYNAGLAERRAAQLVQACRDYNRKHGHYPQSLNDLVPEFLAKVPQAKFGLGGGGSTAFSYMADSHQIYWVIMPPFGRQFVDVESGDEHFLD